MQFAFKENKKCPVCKHILHYFHHHDPVQSRLHCKQCNYLVYKDDRCIELRVQDWYAKIVFVHYKIKLSIDYYHGYKIIKKSKIDKESVFLEFGQQIKFERDRFNRLQRIKDNEENEKLFYGKQANIFLIRK